MGSGSFSTSAYRAFTTASASKTTDEIYSLRSIDKSLDPKGVKLRESRDSADNPNSTPVIIALDVTGSMGIIADTIARKGLGVLFQGILDRKPITNPHLMFMAIGDAHCDEAPLQVSQFEADNRIVEQLTKIWIEHGGGGNKSESYNFPWYFAANHTEHDAYIKRGKRGYLFTIGDEEAPENLTRAQIKKFIGDTIEADQSSAVILAEAQRTYDVFHIVIKEGDYARSHLSTVMSTWTALLGQRVIPLADHTKLGETIISAMEIAEGRNVVEVTSAFGKSVHDAVKHLPSSRQPKRLALH